MALLFWVSVCNNFIGMRNGSNLNDLMMSLAGKSDSKLGFTTTVKEQVEDIEVTMDHFKKSLDSQRKQQSELQMQLKKLEESTKTEFQELHKEISERVNYLTELFKSDSSQQNKEFEYLELQNATLHDEHDRLNEMVGSVMGRTEETENNVGI